jgi:hypothetical protein
MTEFSGDAIAVALPVVAMRCGSLKRVDVVGFPSFLNLNFDLIWPANCCCVLACGLGADKFQS